MFDKLKSTLQAAAKTGPYAPLTPDEKRLAVYALKVVEMKRDFTSYYKFPNSNKIALLDDWNIDTSQFELLSSSDAYSNRMAISKFQNIQNRLSEDEKLALNMKTRYIYVSQDLSHETAIDSVRWLIDRILHTQYARANSSHRIYDEFQTSAFNSEIHRFAYLVLIENILISIKNRLETDSYFIERQANALNEHAKISPERINPINESPEVIYNNPIMNFYYGAAFSATNIAARREIRAAALRTKAEAEQKRKEAEERAAAQEREKKAQEASRLLRADHVRRYADGSINVSLGNVDYAIIPKTDYFEFRNNVAQKTLELFSENTNISINHDRISIKRPFGSLSFQSKAVVLWLYCCSRCDVLPSSKLDYSQQDRTEWMILSCMLSEEYVEKQNTGLAMTDMYKNIENDAYNAVMIQAKKRSVSSVYSEITSYASKFTSEPGAFGDLARMVCGQNTNSGWATSQ